VRMPSKLCPSDALAIFTFIMVPLVSWAHSLAQQ
jgi:hypothetical protein